VDDAMGEAPCGCAREIELRRAGQPVTDAVKQLQREWGCPAATGTGAAPRDGAHLSAGCRSALDEVRRLTGAEGFTTCPRWHCSRPWVARAVDAHTYREKGSLAAVEALPLPAALVDALREIDAGSAERFAHDQKQQAARDDDEPRT
jgi:hypothetical protein